jgi:hypothetical protein
MDEKKDIELKQALRQYKFSARQRCVLTLCGCAFSVRGTPAFQWRLVAVQVPPVCYFLRIISKINFDSKEATLCVINQRLDFFYWVNFVHRKSLTQM